MRSVAECVIEQLGEAHARLFHLVLGVPAHLSIEQAALDASVDRLVRIKHAW